MPDTEPNDQPLTRDDIEDRNAPLRMIAERVITHLEGDWHVRPGTYYGADLNGPDDVRLTFTEFGDLLDSHEFAIGTFTLTGRTHQHSDRMNAYTLPSQIAAHLESKTIPEARKRIETARKQKAVLQKRNDERKALIKSIADRLNWNASSYQCKSHEFTSLGPGHSRRRWNTEALVYGHVKSTDDGLMNISLGDLPGELVDQIVDLVTAHFQPQPQKEADK